MLREHYRHRLARPVQAYTWHGRRALTFSGVTVRGTAVAQYQSEDATWNGAMCAREATRVGEVTSPKVYTAGGFWGNVRDGACPGRDCARSGSGRKHAEEHRRCHNGWRVQAYA